MTVTLAAAMFATVLSAGTTSPNEALTRARVNAYLGSDATTPEEWKQLDATAVPFLTKVINDRDESPSRRVRAIFGLSLLGAHNDTETFMDLARAETEPIAVRTVALRTAMGRIPKAEAMGPLKALLKGSHSTRMRVMSAEYLTRFSKSVGCVAVRVQVEKEKPQNQKSFQRALRYCPPPPEPTAAETPASPPAPEPSANPPVPTAPEPPGAPTAPENAAQPSGETK